MVKSITGIVLAGGKSSRMGTDKGVLELQGVSFLKKITDELKPLCREIIIVANNNNYNNYGYKVVADIVKEKGPVGGIYTGLKHSTSEWNLVVSCDVPFVTRDVFAKLIQSTEKFCNAVIPLNKGKSQPLTALYRSSTMQIFEKALMSNTLKLKMVNEWMSVVNVEMSTFDFYSEKLFYNINTPDELTYAKEQCR